MDTLILLRSESFVKLLEKMLYLSVIIGVVCLQGVFFTNPIMADDLKLAHNIAPVIDAQSIKEKIMLEMMYSLRLFCIKFSVLFAN